MKDKCERIDKKELREMIQVWGEYRLPEGRKWSLLKGIDLLKELDI